MQKFVEKELKSEIKLLQKGSSDAFKRIYNFYFKRVYSFCYNFTHSSDSAEDLTQDIFVKIWNNHKSLDFNLNFEAFLFKVARNEVYNYIRSLAIRKNAISNEIDYNMIAYTNNSDDADSKLLYNELISTTHEIIENMPPQRKLVYSLCRDGQCTYEEAAEKLRISVNSVKTHMKLAIKSFREQLAPLVELMIVSFFLFFK